MIYFDNAATTRVKPPAVAEAVMAALSDLGNPGRSIHGGAMNASRIVFETRLELARLFGAESPDRIAFTANSTQALNMAIKGILNPGDHVITTALEHNSVLRPLYEMEDRGVELTVLPADELGRLNPDDFENQIKENTKAVVCTHGSNLTGNLVDIEKVGRIARENGLLFVVDASQTAGVFPIDVRKMNIDILCFTGHKGLLGPQGTGGIYVREGVKLRPMLSGGSGVQTYLRSHPPQMPTALEAGTLNAHGIAGLLAALGYIRETGMDTIREREQMLADLFYQQVRQIPGIRIYGDFTDPMRCPIVALNVRDYDSGQVSDALWEQYAIATRPGAHCAPLMHQALGTVEQGAVRFSFSHYNTEEEINIAVSALRELAQEEKMEKTIDCRGMACPLPVVNAKKAAEELNAGDVLTVLVDNEIAVQNLQRFATGKGFQATGSKTAEKEYAVVISIAGTAEEQVQEEITCNLDMRQKGLVVVLSANTMGTGDAKLGTSLMKAFVFALTKQDRLPETILCYNTGAYLTCEGADTLEDLKLLESEGVTVLTCGTCLDFYGLKEKLAVGGVTNMYDIVERMEKAGSIVKP